MGVRVADGGEWRSSDGWSCFEFVVRMYIRDRELASENDASVADVYGTWRLFLLL